jgi:hypothetical protein
MWSRVMGKRVEVPAGKKIVRWPCRRRATSTGVSHGLSPSTPAPSAPAAPAAPAPAAPAPAPTPAPDPNPGVSPPPSPPPGAAPASPFPTSRGSPRTSPRSFTLSSDRICNPAQYGKRLPPPPPPPPPQHQCVKSPRCSVDSILSGKLSPTSRVSSGFVGSAVSAFRYLGSDVARHVIRCRLTQATRVRIAWAGLASLAASRSQSTEETRFALRWVTRRGEHYVPPYRHDTPAHLGNSRAFSSRREK